MKPHCFGTRLYDLVEIYRGRETVVKTDSLVKVRARMRTLKASRRGDKIEYYIRESSSDPREKYSQKPDAHKRSGGCAVKGPRLVKWNN